jgi:diguanylate cyclase (GGDEF)-like protein
VRSMAAFTLIAVACWWALRGRPQRFRLVAWVYEGVCLLEYTSALLFVPEDELRLLWFLVNIPGVFLLLGPRSGWAITGLSLLLLLGLNPALQHPYSGNAQATLVLAVLYLGVMFHVFGDRSVSYFSRMRRYNLKLLKIASHDALTGVLNARAYQAQCQLAIEAGATAGRGYSVLFVDLDHFKRVNDQHGHATGDRVLQAAAQALQKGVRHSDIVGRIGGEEFGVLLPHTDLDQALRVAEHLRHSIEQLQWPIGVDGQGLKITASMGVANSPDGQISLQSLQQRADSAMYQAKAAGRNRVTSLPVSKP